MKLDNQPGLIIAGISPLRFRPLQIFELNKLAFIAAQVSSAAFNFARISRVTRSPSACVGEMTRADLPSLDGRSVIRGQGFMPFFGGHFPQHSELVQPLESVFQIARPQISDDGLVCIRLLPPDFFQFRGLQIGVFFQNAAARRRARRPDVARCRRKE